MGTRIQLPGMIRLDSMYPCLFRFNYHKIVTLLITKCFEEVCIITACNQLLFKTTITKLICILHLVAYADGEAFLKFFLINSSLYST